MHHMPAPPTAFMGQAISTTAFSLAWGRGTTGATGTAGVIIVSAILVGATIAPAIDLVMGIVPAMATDHRTMVDLHMGAAGLPTVEDHLTAVDRLTVVDPTAAADHPMAAITGRANR